MEILLVAGSKMVASMKAASPAVVSSHFPPSSPLSTHGVARPLAVSACGGTLILQATTCSSSPATATPLAVPTAWAPKESPICACTTPPVTASRQPRAMVMKAVLWIRRARRAPSDWRYPLEGDENRDRGMAVPPRLSHAPRGTPRASACLHKGAENYRGDGMNLSDALPAEMTLGIVESRAREARPKSSLSTSRPCALWGGVAHGREPFEPSNCGAGGDDRAGGGMSLGDDGDTLRDAANVVKS